MRDHARYLWTQDTRVMVVELLRRSADQVERRGWWDGQGPSCGRVCIVTAIHMTASRDIPVYPVRVRATVAAEQAVRDLLAQDGWLGLTTFNDYPGRTAAEVVGALRRAADRVAGVSSLTTTGSTTV